MNIEQSRRLLAAIKVSAIALKQLGFTDELTHIICKTPNLDTKYTFPTQDPAFIKDFNENFRPKILQVIKQKLLEKEEATAPADMKASEAAARDVKESQPANDLNDKIKLALTHFVRLRLLFTGMTVGQAEYNCTDPQAAVAFPDAKAEGSKLPLALDELQPVAERTPQSASQLLQIIKSQVEFVVVKFFGTAPEPYETSIGQLEHPPRLGMLHELKLQAEAAFIWSQHNFYYVNIALNRCERLTDEKYLALKKYLPEQQGFKRLSEIELKEISQTTGFVLPTRINLSAAQQLAAAFPATEAEAPHQVAAAAAAIRVNETLQSQRNEAALDARIENEYVHLLDDAQTFVAANARLATAIASNEARNAEIAAENSELYRQKRGPLDDLPPEFADIADLVNVGSAYALFRRRNYQPNRPVPPAEPAPESRGPKPGSSQE